MRRIEMSQTLNRPFKCYFCNKTIKNESQMGHTTVCSSVLLPCPIKCGSYIRRMDLSKHRMECPSRTPRNNVKILSESECSETDLSTDTSSGTLNKRLVACLVHEEPSKHRLSLPSDGRQRAPPSPHQEIRQCWNLQNFQQQQIHALKLHHEHMADWKRETHSRIVMLQSRLSSYDTFRKETNLHWMAAQQKFMQLDKMQLEVEQVKGGIGQEQTYLRKCLSNMSAEIAAVKDSLSVEVGALKGASLDQSARSEAAMIEVRRLDESVGELKAKLASLIFDVRALSQIASEATEKLEIQERRFREFKAEFVQLKADVQAVEEAVASQRNVANCCSPGQFLWKITECDAKMEDAKAKGTVVKSPIFYTHNHGYKLRLHLYFNGLNKWKDRYALFCLYVLKGDYDMLLKWPCNIEGVVTLRDLESLDDPKNFTKKITAKRRTGGEDTEDPQESSTSYIFIPHTTMLKSKYMKDDTMFVDVQIDDKYLCT